MEKDGVGSQRELTSRRQTVDELPSVAPRAAWDVKAHLSLLAPEDGLRFVSRVFQHAVGMEPGAEHPRGLPFLAAKIAACPPGGDVRETALYQARELGRRTGQWRDWVPGTVLPQGAIVFFPATAANQGKGRVALSLGGGKLRCSRAEEGGTPQVLDWDVERLAAEESAPPAGWFSSSAKPRIETPAPDSPVVKKGSSVGVRVNGGLKAPQGRMQRGMTGEMVEQLQRALAALGFLTPAQLKAGLGVFGPQTHEALARFQASHGLSGTGIYGPNTRAVLGKTLGEKPR